MPLPRFAGKLFSRSALAGLALALPGMLVPAYASTAATADDAVQLAVDRTLAALEDSHISDAEAASILELIDMERVARFTLGRHWRGMDDAEKADFVAAFRTYAKNQLREHLSGMDNAEVEIIRTVERDSGDVVVMTRVTGVERDAQQVNWRVQERDGWKITDIEAMDLWFAIEQRAQFQATLDRNGGDVRALINQIKAG